MKKYESPVILENEDLAEGIYANSGANPSGPEEPQCWTVSVSKEQVVSQEKYANFRVRANHIGTVHISTASTVTIVFNLPITNAYFEGFGVSVNGCTVVLTREQHGNAYNCNDQYDTLLKVYCEDPDGLAVISSTISCTKAPNVQGGYDG